MPSKRISQQNATDFDGLTDVARRWSPVVVKQLGFTPVATYFLRNYTRLKITPIEAMVLIHVISYQWDARPPFPSLPRLAKELGLSTVQVRTHIRSLEKKEVLRRERKHGRASRLHLDGLRLKLANLIKQDRQARSDAKEGDYSAEEMEELTELLH